MIVGAGLGGLFAGALLAAKEHRKVLVAEKESFIGGRAVSFVGKRNKVCVMDRHCGLKEFMDALRSVHTWVARSQPDIETIFAKGLLDGWTIEAGGHGSFWGNKGRIYCMMNYLRRPVEMRTNAGFCVIDPEDHTKWYQVQHGIPYPWMKDGGTETIWRQDSSPEIGKRLISGRTGI